MAAQIVFSACRPLLDQSAISAAHTGVMEISGGLSSFKSLEKSFQPSLGIFVSHRLEWQVKSGNGTAPRNGSIGSSFSGASLDASSTPVLFNAQPRVCRPGGSSTRAGLTRGTRGQSGVARAVAEDVTLVESNIFVPSVDLASTGTAQEEEDARATDRCFQQKYRPRRFDDLVGHSIIAKVLKAHVEKDIIKPAYLFSGPKGTGKTSAARIFAAAINCTYPKLGKPCGRCKQCRASARGSNTDIREIDAASNSGVENVRALLETVRYAPISARYKVYIIDECHMLSKEAANALLKTLEEPPSHVVFILVTTDPQKLLEPVLSRCDWHKFRRISDQDAVNVIKKIAQKEKIDVDDEALKLVAQLSDGSLRDATKMLGNVACIEEKVTVELVEDLLGVVPTAQVISVLANALQGDRDGAMCRQLEYVLQDKEPWQVLMRLTQLLVDLLTGEPRLQRPLSSRNDEQARLYLLKLAGSPVGKDNMRRALLKLQEAEVQVRQAPVPSLWLKSSLMQLPLFFSPMEPSMPSTSFQSGNRGLPGTSTQPLSLYPSRFAVPSGRWNVPSVAPESFLPVESEESEERESAAADIATAVSKPLFEDSGSTAVSEADSVGRSFPAADRSQLLGASEQKEETDPKESAASSVTSLSAASSLLLTDKATVDSGASYAEVLLGQPAETEGDGFHEEVEQAREIDRTEAVASNSEVDIEAPQNDQLIIGYSSPSPSMAAEEVAGSEDSLEQQVGRDKSEDVSSQMAPLVTEIEGDLDAASSQIAPLVSEIEGDFDAAGASPAAHMEGSLSDLKASVSGEAESSADCEEAGSDEAGDAGQAREAREETKSSADLEGLEDVDLEGLMARALDLMTVKTHKSLLSSRGRIVAVSKAQVTLEFTGALLAKAQKPQAIRHFETAFSKALEREVTVLVVPAAPESTGAKVGARTRAKSQPEGQQVRRRVVEQEAPAGNPRGEEDDRVVAAGSAGRVGVGSANKVVASSKPLLREAISRTGTEVNRSSSTSGAKRGRKAGAAVAIGSRKAEDDEYHERFTNEDAAKAWDDSGEREEESKQGAAMAEIGGSLDSGDIVGESNGDDEVLAVDAAQAPTSAKVVGDTGGDPEHENKQLPGGSVENKVAAKETGNGEWVTEIEVFKQKIKAAKGILKNGERKTESPSSGALRAPRGRDSKSSKSLDDDSISSDDDNRPPLISIKEDDNKPTKKVKLANGGPKEGYQRPTNRPMKAHELEREHKKNVAVKFATIFDGTLVN